MWLEYLKPHLMVSILPCQLNSLTFTFIPDKMNKYFRPRAKYLGRSSYETKGRCGLPYPFTCSSSLGLGLTFRDGTNNTSVHLPQIFKFYWNEILWCGGFDSRVNGVSLFINFYISTRWCPQIMFIKHVNGRKSNNIRWTTIFSFLVFLLLSDFFQWWKKLKWLRIVWLISSPRIFRLK